MWGEVYEGSGDAAELARSLESICLSEGLQVQKKEGTRRVELLLSDRRHWFLSMTKGRIQKALWSFDQRDDTCRITCDSDLLAPSKLLVLAIAAVWPPLLLASAQFRTVFLSGGLFLSVALLWAPPFFLRNTQAYRFWEVLQLEAERSGGYIAKTSHGLQDRTTFYLVLYLIYTCIAALFVLSVPSPLLRAFEVAESGSMVILGLLILVGLLVCALAWTLANRSFSVRTSLLLPGLCAILSFGLLLGAQLPWAAAARNAPIADLRMLESLPEQRIVAMPVWHELRAMTWMSAFGTLFIVTTALIAAAMAIQASWLTRGTLKRLRTQGRHEPIRAAVSGSGFLNKMSILFHAAWALGSVLVVAGVITAAANGIQAMRSVIASGVGDVSDNAASLCLHLFRLIAIGSIDDQTANG